MAIFLADNHVSFDGRERLESRYIRRHRSHIGTLAEQRVLARTTCWRARELLDPKDKTRPRNIDVMKSNQIKYIYFRQQGPYQKITVGY